MFSKVCPICHKEFQSEARNKKYCSPECLAKGSRKLKIQKARRAVRRKDYSDNAESYRLVSKAYALAKCVAETFGIPKVCACACDECSGELQLHHKDVNIFNNSPTNLEYRCNKHHSQYHSEVPDVNMTEVLKECANEEDFDVKLIVFRDKVGRISVG